MAQHNELGKNGERLAVTYLKKNKYKILERNYRFQKAEIDIIAQKENVLAVVEVKTRSTDYFGNPENFVNSKKIKLLLSAVDYYVIENDLNVDIRFDIISIIHQQNNTKIKHIKDAFLYF